jgi:cell division protein ZapA (FtsZ GTPase activity inhibitor)
MSVKASQLQVASVGTDMQAKNLADRLIQRLRELGQEIEKAKDDDTTSPYELQKMSKTYYDLEESLGRIRFQGAGGR